MIDNFQKKNQLDPNEKISVEYVSNYRNVTESTEEPQIYNSLKKSKLKDKEGNVLKRSPEFTIKQIFMAYIKKTYYTPNGTKIEEVGD